LRETAAQLDASLTERLALARSAQTGWEGRFRDEFDSQLANAAHVSVTLQDEMLALAAQIERASEDATREQRKRLQGREAWWREKAREASHKQDRATSGQEAEQSRQRQIDADKARVAARSRAEAEAREAGQQAQGSPEELLRTPDRDRRGEQ
jgi:hypothetical protein